MPECPLCFEEFGPTVQPVSLPCGHVICEDDISLVTQSARCPSCRQPFVPGAKGNIRKLFLEFDTEPRPSQQSASILPAAQQEEVRFLSALMRDLGIDAPANGALSLDSSAVSRLQSSLDLLSVRLADTAGMRDGLSQARAKSATLQTELDELRRVNSTVIADFTKEFDLLVSDSTETRDELTATQHDLEAERRKVASYEKMLREINNLRCHLVSDPRSGPRGTTSHHPHFSFGLSSAPSISPSAAPMKALAGLPHNTNGEIVEDLTFQEGDIINLVNKTSGVWWIGMSEGRVGCVRDNFIKISNTDDMDIPEARALRSHNMSGEIPEDLPLSMGKTITLIDKPTGVWWVGHIDGRVGCVPYEKLKISHAGNGPLSVFRSSCGTDMSVRQSIGA